MKLQKYKEIVKKLDKVTSEGRFDVEFVDGSHRMMNGVELVLYVMSEAAYEGIDNDENITPIVSYKLVYGEDDLTPFMREWIDTGITAGLEYRKRHSAGKEQEK